MHRALDVPALVIIVVERREVHVLRAGLHAGQARQVGEVHARPRRDGRPPFDAKVIEPVAMRGSAARSSSDSEAACAPCRRPRAATARAALRPTPEPACEMKYDGKRCARRLRADARHIHRRVAKQHALERFVLRARRTRSSALRRLRPVRVARRENERTERAAGRHEKAAPVDARRSACRAERCDAAGGGQLGSFARRKQVHERARVALFGRQLLVVVAGDHRRNRVRDPPRTP